MGIFSSKKSYVGVDLGTSSVKVVECADEKGKPKLVTYGYMEQPLDVLKSDSKEAMERIVTAVKTVCAKAKVSTKKAVTALPTFSVFSAVINLPEMQKKDLSEAVNREARKYVPMPIEEMILDWKIIEKETARKEAAAAAKSQDILITAAPKNLVSRYIEIFKKSGYELIGLETEAFALERCLIGNDKSTIMILDIGAVAADISIVSKGYPVLNRSINTGGNTITKAIMNSMNVEARRAEQFKRDLGLVSQGGEPVPKPIQMVIDSIINEVKHLMDLYINQTGEQVEKIVLTGGSAYLPGLVDYIANTINVRAFIGDPWARMIYPLELKSVLQELGPRFSVAIGLAMREIV